MATQNRITLKNIKHMASLSEETHCFTATVYFDGKKVAEASNRGHGGCTDVHYESHQAGEAVADFISTLPDVVSSIPDFTYKQDDESVINDLLEDFLFQKQIKADLKKKIMYLADDGSIRGTKTMTAQKRDLYLGEYLPKLLKDWGIKQEQILNLMPFEKAYSILEAQA